MMTIYLKTSTKEAFQKTISILGNNKYNSYAILICIMINLFKFDSIMLSKEIHVWSFKYPENCS